MQKLALYIFPSTFDIQKQILQILLILAFWNTENKFCKHVFSLGNKFKIIYILYSSLLYQCWVWLSFLKTYIKTFKLGDGVENTKNGINEIMTNFVFPINQYIFCKIVIKWPVVFSVTFLFQFSFTLREEKVSRTRGSY